MSLQKRIDRYLQETLDLLEGDGFEIFENERYLDGTFPAVAAKLRSVGIGTQELVFVFATFTRLTDKKMQDFTDDAYAYAKETRKAGNPVSTLWVYPVALAEEATDDAIDAVRQ